MKRKEGYFSLFTLKGLTMRNFMIFIRLNKKNQGKNENK